MTEANLKNTICLNMDCRPDYRKKILTTSSRKALMLKAIKCSNVRFCGVLDSCDKKLQYSTTDTLKISYNLDIA